MQIKISHLCKDFRSARVLDDVNLTLESGHIYGIVGRNGSGKTMLLRAIAGLIVPSEGTVSVDGKLLHKDISFPPDMGILIEKPELLPHLTAMKNLEMLAEIKGNTTKETIAAYMRDLELDPDSKQPMRKFSQGMKQKVGIIQAIMENQQVLILDEPFNALDEKSVLHLHNLFLQYRSQGRLLVLTSHHKEDIAALCDTVYLMKEGRLTPAPQ